MGKTSRRQMPWHEKNKLGCMWSWMSMFEFGNGKGAQKLLSDKRPSNLNASAHNAPKNKLKMLKDVEENGQGSEDCIGSRGQVSEANQLSVKRLIEVDMGTDNKKKRNKISIPESEAGRIRRDQILLNETCKGISEKALSDPDVGESLGSDECGSDLYIEAIMQEIFSHIQQKSMNWSKDIQRGEPIQSEEKLSLLEERISEATKVIMRQKFLNGGQLTEARKVQYYNKYMDTLEMLNTNKEFFLKLSEDPNSSLMKQSKRMLSPNLKKINLGDVRPSEEIGSRSQYLLFRRKLSSQNEDMINDKCKPSEASNKIVILKPERTESHASTSASSPIVRYNVTSQFSFSEIRRKLRLAMGKGQHGTSSTEVASASPYKNQKLRIGDKPFSKDQPGISSASKNHFYVEKLPKPFSGLDKGNKVKNKHDASSKQRVSSIYIEAKRHLSELLNNGDEDEGLSCRHTSETLENLLSVPEHNLSPPRRAVMDLTDTNFATQEFSSHTEGQPCNTRSPEIEADYQIELVHSSAPSSEIDLCSSDDNFGNVSDACNVNSNLYEDKKEVVPEHNLSPPRHAVVDLTDTNFATQEFSSHTEGKPCNRRSQEIEADYQIELVHSSAPSSEIDLCSTDDNFVNVSDACNGNSNLYKKKVVPEHNLSPPRRAVMDLTDTNFATQEFSSHTEAQPCNTRSQEIEADYQIELVHSSAPSSEIDLCSTDDNFCNASDACNVNSNLYKDKKEVVLEVEEHAGTSSAISYELILQGDMEDLQATETRPQLAGNETIAMYKPTSMTASLDDQIISTSEIYEVEALSRWDEQGAHDEYISSSPKGHPSFSAINIITENLANSMDKSERPSPISVLEHVFSEDEISPAVESHPCHVEPRRLRPICIQFDEDELSPTTQVAHVKGSLENKDLVFRYVETILLSSEFCWEEYYITSLLSKQLLNLSLLEEVQILFHELSYDDCRLVFDCVNEVLNGMCQRYFGSCPLASYLKLNIRPIPEPANIIQEVWEGIAWHLLLPPPPRSLEQIVRKDLERDTLWMDLRYDVDDVSVDMETIILDDLMDDTVLSCIQILVRDESSPSQLM